ncbi:DUF2934 domain-containing protein [Ancylobacter oerskovii]|uniref:DUF2934 domain-containing protein n=1 Tax=Ancylobacter oerskovii TaxID=459519 RepID=A0ABW4Z1M8_9HYPH|nr:DUF2934 domain-containing protein [Ancylobacter oerskovii]MBS7542542.1 DUF2934 domain-containing protein [Ancylobacter oerskovii]
MSGREERAWQREEQVRIRAHSLWEKEGRPDGQAERHWFQAKELVEKAIVRRRARAAEQQAAAVAGNPKGDARG